MNADTVDRNIPRAAFGMIFQVTRTIGRDPDVPICRECNRLSADVAFRTPEQKRRHIRRALLSRHGSHLNVADWQEGEIFDLGYSLRTAVVAGVDQKECLEQRLKWPRLRPKRD